MKMIHCECGDWVALSATPRTCFCGKSSGKYVDTRKVEVAGPCVVVGVDNRVLRRGVGETWLIGEPNVWVERR